MASRLFDEDTCDRCHSELSAKQMSWFTTETLCMDCIDREQLHKEAMRNAGMNPMAFEGCGYMPALPIGVGV